MRMLVFLVILIGLLVFASQNWLPVLPLVVFGSKTLELPVAVWAIAAIAAGIATGVVLQILNYRPPRAAMGSSRREVEPPPFPREPQPLRDREPFPPRQTRFPAGEPEKARTQTRVSPEPSDWETPSPQDDWNLEEPSPPPPRPKPNLEKKPPNPPPSPKEEKGDNRSGDRVYDANYRVIDPPVPPPEEKSEEEDWGFDDEEFQSEYRRNWDEGGNF